MEHALISSLSSRLSTMPCFLRYFVPIVAISISETGLFLPAYSSSRAAKYSPSAFSIAPLSLPFSISMLLRRVKNVVWRQWSLQ